MSAISAESNLGTTEVREGFELDRESLERWLSEHLSDYRGPLSIEQFKGGQSNPTYKLVTPQRAYVLRRKPFGSILKGAHAIEREARVLLVLESTGFPVAHVHALCEDSSVIGAPFYVMDMVEGRVFWDATLPGFSPTDRFAIFDAMNEVIASLHGIDYAAIGLSDFGRPGNFFERQIGRWSRQYLEDTAAGRDPHMDLLIEWLPKHIPPTEESSIVHGDFRIDNLIFHPGEARVLAVLDWELSTLGHPGADFAYHAMMYRTPPHIVAGLAGTDVARLGVPDERQYLEAYCRRSGRAEMPEYDFYIAFNFFRLAAIFHGIKGRVLRGTASSAAARERAAAFPELAALAYSQAARL